MIEMTWVDGVTVVIGKYGWSNFSIKRKFR